MLSGYLEQLRVLAADPTSNLVAAAMGVSVAVLLLVIIVLILLFFALSPGTSRKRGVKGTANRPRMVKAATPEQIARRLERRRQARSVWWTTIAGGLLLAWIALYAGTSANLYCGNTCHAMVVQNDSWKKSAHENVACVRCHEGEPATSAITGTVSRLRSLYYSMTDTSGHGVQVPSSRCLSCHEAILDATIVTNRAIAISHAEPVAAGAACTDCHGAQGHQGESLLVGMSTCLRCHDGEQARTDCTLCHPKGIEAGRPIESKRTGNPVRLPDKPSCGGCHPQDKCDACHGLRMPHARDYKTPQKHAMPAAFEGKDRLCFRCHTPNDCGECHQDPSLGSHGPAGHWKIAHQKYKRKDGNGYCLWCHSTKDFCSVCH